MPNRPVLGLLLLGSTLERRALSPHRNAKHVSAAAGMSAHGHSFYFVDLPILLTWMSRLHDTSDLNLCRFAAQRR